MTLETLGSSEASPFRWGIEAVTFSGGQRVELTQTGVTMIIGPNQAGKSVALRDLAQAMAGDGTPRLAATNVEVYRNGNEELFNRWLRLNYPLRRVAGRENYFTRGSNLEVASISAIWQQGPTMPAANAFLVHRLDTESRLQIGNQVQAIPLYESPPQAYIHVLQTNNDLLSRISRIVADAFGVHLLINWVLGQHVAFHVGDPPSQEVPTNPVSEEYAEYLYTVPRLETQGDGLRSFVGTLLAVSCGAHPVVLVDEPEAFLHPPQARRLAAAMARTAADRQVIIATHSSDVVQGALSVGAPVTVCRITRVGDVNQAAVLDSSQLSQLWAKPLLRSTSAIDGLFHKGAVVCEGDTDARFYEALLERMVEQDRIDSAPDLYFVHGGGKAELSTLARAYRSLDTLTAAVADLDLLRDQAQFRRLLNILGGHAGESGPYNSLVNGLAGLPPELAPDGLTALLQEVAAQIQTEGGVSDEHKRSVFDAFSLSANWSSAKRYGLAKLRGQELIAARALFDEWKGAGLFLVPVGELEGWWPEGPRSKSEWFVSAIEEIRSNPQSFRDAESFVAELCRFFGLQVTA